VKSSISARSTFLGPLIQKENISGLVCLESRSNRWARPIGDDDDPVFENLPRIRNPHGRFLDQ
jgi:hypothetical protein